MKLTRTETTYVGNITVTRITPLSPDIVRFSLTAKIKDGAKRFTQSTLSLYGALLLTKTKRKSKVALEEYLKRYGITLAITTGIESITFTGSVRSEHVGRVANLLTELLYEPLIDPREFTQKKKLMGEANREAHDNARRIAQIGFVNILYEGESRLTLDTLEKELNHIKKLTVAHIVSLHKTLPQATWYLSVVGDVYAEHGFLPLLKVIELDCSKLERTLIAREPVKNTAKFSTVASKTNIEVQLGNIAKITNDDPSFAAFDFGIDILGKVGAFSGRLMSTVREKEGLTYNIHANTHPHHKGDAFHFVIRTFFMAKDYEKGIASTMRELRSIVIKGITEKELTIFKEINHNEYILAQESNMSRLAFYHNLVVRGYAESDADDMQKKIQRLTRKEVNAALKANINPDNLVLSAAGPISKDGVPLITQKA